jgi:hypothetical protein
MGRTLLLTIGAAAISVIFASFCMAQQVIRGPYLQSGSPTSVVVKWRTDVATDSRVRFGLSPAHLQFAADDLDATTEHEVSLLELSPDAKYYYSVGTTTSEIVGGDFSHFLITAPTEGVQKSTRIWILGDSGTNDANAANVRDAYYNFAGGRHTDLWLMLGDNAYNNGEDHEYQGAVFDMYPEMLRKSVLWPTRGNHDRGPRNEIGEWSDGDAYYDVFTLPILGEAGGMASGTEAYYSFDYGSIHFICLESTSKDLRAITSPMWVWLAEDLAANDKVWTVAFWHHPPYSKGSHNSDNEADLLEMRERGVPLLEASGVDLVLAGHSHSYERSFLLDGHYGKSPTFMNEMKLNSGDGRLDGDGAYQKATFGPAGHEGAVYLVAGSSGKISGGSLDHPAMFVSFNLLGSLVLDIAGNQLHAQFLDNAGAVLDYFTIVKGMENSGPAAELLVVTGDNQSGQSGTTLPLPLVVEARNSDGQPVVGVAVTFQVVAGSGSLSSSQPVTTAINGRAEVMLTPASAGGVTVQAFAPDVSPVFFAAEVFAAPPPTIASFAPASGAVGWEVIITGGFFNSVSDVAFKGVSTEFTVDSESQIRAIVPAGAGTGQISVAATGGMAFSAEDFLVTPPPTTIVLNPSDDAYVDSDKPTNNFGGASDLRVRQTSSRKFISFQKFNVANIDGPLQRASLRLFVSDGGNDGGSLFAVSNDFVQSSLPWTESGINWNNAPLIAGNPLTSFGAVASGAWVEADVTAAIAGEGIYSFAFESGSSDIVKYNSKEGGNAPELVIDIANLPPSPDIAVSPSSHNFGDVAIGESTSRLFQVSNNGLLDLNVASTTVAGSVAADFSVESGGGSFTLTTGEIREISAGFAPTTTGSQSAILRFESDDPDENPFEVTLSGAGFVPQPDIAVAPLSHNFGDVLIDSAKVRTIRLKNVGQLNLTVTNLSLTNDIDFSIPAISLPFEITPGDSQITAVTFRPQSEGEKSGMLNIASSDPDEAATVVDVNGRGIPRVPQISVSPAQHDFGEVVIGDSSAQAFTVVNIGSADLVVSEATLVSADSTDFVRIGEGAFTIAPGDSQHVVILFRPLSAGEKNASLRFISNDADSNPLAVEIAGISVAPQPQIVVAPASHNFGNVIVGGSAEKTVVVSNDGSAELVVTITELVGGESGEFAIDDGGAPYSIFPGDSHEVHLSFQPSTLGAKNATLRVVSNDSPQELSLSGTGVSPAPESVVFIPSDDAYVKSSSQNGNFGSRPDLHLRQTSTDFAVFLKFTLSDLDNVHSAKLRLFVLDGSNDGGSVYGISDDWNEGSVTWNTGPAVTGAALSISGPVSTGEWAEFDVSAAVVGNGVYSFALKNHSKDLAKYSSKEGVEAPQLVVESDALPRPRIDSFAPASGIAGAEVTIAGANFGDATGVAFNGVAANVFGIDANDRIVAEVPASATTGKLSVANSFGAGVSANDFILLIPPSITSFQPTSGSVGATVTIAGDGFSSANRVEFNGRTSDFEIESDLEIWAVVPADATSGPIRVVNSLGAFDSDEDFIVAAGPSELVFLPTDDSHVRSASINKSFGSTTDMRVRQTSSAQFDAYLKFTVSGLGSVPQQAALRVHALEASNSAGAAYLVSNNHRAGGQPWRESQLTWNNAPEIGGQPLSEPGGASANQVVEFDVTDAITANGIYSFAIRTTSTDLVRYSTKEGVFTPQLVITSSAGATTASEVIAAKDFANVLQSALPGDIELGLNYPNPFNSGTVIQYGLPAPAHVSIAIYNLRGQLVRLIMDGFENAGYKEVRWDGRDESGQEVSSGLYFIRLMAGQTVLNGKVILQR